MNYCGILSVDLLRTSKSSFNSIDQLENNHNVQFAQQMTIALAYHILAGNNKLNQHPRNNGNIFLIESIPIQGMFATSEIPSSVNETF